MKRWAIAAAVLALLCLAYFVTRPGTAAVGTEEADIYEAVFRYQRKQRCQEAKVSEAKVSGTFYAINPLRPPHQGEKVPDTFFSPGIERAHHA